MRGEYMPPTEIVRAKTGDHLPAQPFPGKGSSMGADPAEPLQPKDEDLISSKEIGWDIELMERLKVVIRDYSEQLNIPISSGRAGDLIHHYFPELEQPGSFSHGKNDKDWARDALAVAATIIKALHEIAKKPVTSKKAMELAMDAMPDLQIMFELPKVDLNAAQKLDAAVREIMKRKHVDYNQALTAVVYQNSRLLDAYQAMKG